MSNAADWTELSDKDAVRFVEMLDPDLESSGKDWRLVVRRKHLPFYTDCDLFQFEVVTSSLSQPLYALIHDEMVLVLDGTSAPLHQMNRTQNLRLQAAHAIAYLDLFLFAVHGEEGPFTKVDSVEDFGTAQDNKDEEIALLADIASKVHPVRMVSSQADGSVPFRASVVYSDQLFDCTLLLKPDGTVEMTDDTPVHSGIPRHLLPKWNAFGTLNQLIASSKRGNAKVLSLDKSIYRTLLEILLESALLSQGDGSLLSRFRAESDSERPLKKFARLMFHNWPIVAIESDLPFAEEVIAEIVSTLQNKTNYHTIIGAADPSDDSRLSVPITQQEECLVAFSMHAYRNLKEPERVAHTLSVRSLGVFIGCHKSADLPECLRRVVDLTLVLPNIKPALFEMLFQRIVGAPAPPDWALGDARWVQYLLHTDFQQAVRLDLSPAEVLAFLKRRVEARLYAIDPQGAPSLADLHGLNEAKAVAEDLIADLRAANAGTLSWDAVDRGLLLVGPPGTGKTTLARAIAKGCGVKFIAASAASWQVAGHLGDHIRAIRASFAEARRYAPSILFIDEIDSVGNRELFSGSNAGYHTEVVNAVLEQIQGLDSDAPIIVIGATNFAERVDPALKRAGRLDRVITIPYPNVDALEAIFRFYLRPHETTTNLSADLDTRALAALSFGGTGADIESFVRGAARRARKLLRPISQSDLVAEITGKPRSAEGGRRLTPDEMHRVAVHEAGHALARCLSSSKGQDITYVSIVPRANGTLGFVASMPSDKVMITYQEFLERLEVTLGGRAAESIVFGKDSVSGGAGGDSESSDLAVATRIATSLVCLYGFGASVGLRWSKNVTADQDQEIDQLLRTAFESVKQKLTAHGASLSKLAEELVLRQEVSGAELLQFLGVSIQCAGQLA